MTQEVDPNPSQDICPSCGASLAGERVCPNCGTALSTNIDPVQPSNELKPLDQVLLERFEKDPLTEPRSAPYQVIIGILLGVLAVAMVMWLATQKEEKFAEGRTEQAHGEHHPGDGHDHGMSPADSAQMAKQMEMLNERIDSLEHYVEDNPKDDSARINLATALSIKGDYPKAKTIYEAHLAKYPNDADVRVDYASVVIETTNDPRAGMAELERAIKADPQNAKALFNAGILALQLQEDHNAGFAKSREYLKRAKAASIKTNPQFAAQIDMLIAEMDKKSAEIKSKQDSAAKAGGDKY